MEEIIRAITMALDAEKKVEAYFGLGHDEKQTLFEKLANVKTEALGIFLNAVYPEETNKDLQKLIRRLLFKLKSAGIKTEEPKTTGESVIRKIEKAREHRGFLSNYDETGTRLVVLGLEIKKDAYAFFNVEIHFSEGLLELMTAPVEKKGLEEILKTYRDDTKSPMVFEEVSPAYTAYLIEEASKRSGKFRDEMKSLKSFFANSIEGIRKPQDIYSLSFPNEGGTPAIDEILGHDLFKPFLLKWSSLEEDRKAYNSTGVGAILLPPHMAQEQKRGYMKELTGRNGMKSLRPLLKRMMEDYAYLFYCTKEFGHYKGLTDYLKKDNLHEEAFIYFLAKSLESAETKERGSELIVKPYG